MDLQTNALSVKEQRIFIGNLPNDVKLNHLYSALPTGFDKTKLEIKHNYDIDKSVTSTFAFINLKGTPTEIQAWCDSTSKKSIGGNVLDVQFAKQSFLERLKEEVNNQKIKSASEEKSKLDVPPTFSYQVSSNLIKFNSDESSETSSSDSEEENYQVSDKGDLEVKCKNNLNAELKRLESINERRNTQVNQQNIIKTAINKLSKGPSTKIIFNDSEEEQSSNSIDAVCSNKRKLFDNSDSDEDNAKIDFSQSKPKTKLIHTKISSCDERFRMDSRFFDKNDNDDLNHGNSNDEDTEKSNILKIVDSIIHEDPTVKRPKIKNKNDFKTVLPARFDPLEKNHSSLIIKKDEDIESIQEKKPVKVKQFKVSKDRFYDVSDNLKEQFKKNDNTTSFSLLGLFSDGKTEVPKIEEFLEKDEFDKQNEDKQKKIKTVKNPITKGIPNFFNIDECSDGEGDKELNEKDAAGNNETPWHEPLFITTRDPRVLEAMQFFNTPPEDTLPHAVISSNLKKIVKKKYQRNMAKTKLFKNKLGNQRKFQKGNEIKKKKIEIMPTIK